LREGRREGGKGVCRTDPKRLRPSEDHGKMEESQRPMLSLSRRIGRRDGCAKGVERERGGEHGLSRVKSGEQVFAV